MACSSGCPTPGLHTSWGSCVRAKSIETADPTARAHHQDLYKGLDEYRAARAEGLQPASTSRKDVAFARQVSDATNTIYRADKL